MSPYIKAKHGTYTHRHGLFISLHDTERHNDMLFDKNNQVLLNISERYISERSFSCCHPPSDG
jgi:hypothetical protein